MQLQMNIKITSLIILSLLLAVFLVSCSSDEKPLSQDPTPQNKVLVIERTPSSEEDYSNIENTDSIASESAVQEIENPPATTAPELVVPEAPAEGAIDETSQSQTEPESEAETQTIDPADLPPAQPEVGFSAPDFSLTTLNGDTVSLSGLRGKNVVINYWVTWCVPCMEELVALENLHRVYQGQDFELLTVNGIEQDNLAEVTQTVQDRGLTYPVLLDEGENFWKSYQVLFLPTSFFIDENGIIRSILFGGDSEADFKSKIDQLLSDQL
jgi:peroxiredoxin